MTSEDTDEPPPPAKPSSWSAALSQLPGFPREAQPPPSQPSEAVRTIAPMKGSDER
jgi:hypothetical protein